MLGESFQIGSPRQGRRIHTYKDWPLGWSNLTYWDDPRAIVTSLNFTRREDGMMVTRPAANLLATLTGFPTQLFYSQALGRIFVQEGLELCRYSSLGASRTVIATFSAAGFCAMTDFGSQLVVVHPIDGVFTYDGATWTNRSTTVKGNCIAAWQNKVWVGGDPSNLPRVWWSNAGSAETWTTATDYVDIRDVDTSEVTALGGGRGMDILGRPGLLVFKYHSTYRINSATTGAYTTLDNRNGAVNDQAIAFQNGVTVAIGPDKVIRRMTDDSSLTPITRLVSLYDYTTWSVTVWGAIAVPERNSFYFGVGPSDLLEWQPETGAMFRHRFGVGGGVTGGSFNLGTNYVNGKVLLCQQDYKGVIQFNDIPATSTGWTEPDATVQMVPTTFRPQTGGRVGGIIDWVEIGAPTASSGTAITASITKDGSGFIEWNLLNDTRSSSSYGVSRYIGGGAFRQFDISITAGFGASAMIEYIKIGYRPTDHR